MKNRIIIYLLLSCYFVTVHASSILVEAENFIHKGGWVVDQQFMDLMGSSYLMAHGLGVPVEDAVTNINLPNSGTYYVYVRTYNWTSPWKNGKGPGQFSLIINNKILNSGLGIIGSQWQWQYAGKLTSKSIDLNIRLHDLTGFNGRCDAIYFTTDENDVPPNDRMTLDSFRRSKLKISKPEVQDNYDLIVVGGGIAGMSAAVSAARLGCNVALINDRPILGGNNSSDIRVHMGGAIEIGNYPELGGLQKEFAPSKGGNAQPKSIYEDNKKMSWIQSQDNVKLFTNYRAISVDVENNHIKSVTAKHIETGKEIVFHGKVYADCTGDGTIGYLAGADYRMGRESKYEFNESIAPEKADSMVMGASVQWYSSTDKKINKFPSFNYGINFNEKNYEPVDHGEWTWETGMYRNQINEAEKIRDYGMLVIFSNWSYIKNNSSVKEKFKNSKLCWVAYIAGKRESRRLLGDYILKEDDLRKHVAHEDASFTTTWSIDLHRPDPKNSHDFPGNEFKATTDHTVIYPYSVPYRCLYSRNIKNLFMAGRDISVTHVALGTVRVMRTTGMMGEVVGMASFLCKKYDVFPRNIYHHHLDELKSLMKAGVNVKGLINNQNYNEGGRLFEEPIVR